MTLKIAVIGAGLAGLTAAYRLYQQGHDIEIYEARSRVGGRVFTALMKNSEGTYSTIEIGGQNISDGGEAVGLLNLAQELGLSIIEKEILLSLLVCQNNFCQDFDELLSEYDFLINNSNIDILAKNCVSIAELLDKLFPEDNSLKLAIQTRLTAYEGLEVKNQSIYHNIDTLKSILKGGISREHALKKIIFKEIQGGNAKLPLKIAEILKSNLYLNKALTQVLRDKNQIKLIFADNTSALCDKLILAIPAAVYDNIKFDIAIVPEKQLQQISSIAYGENYKIFVPIDAAFKTKHRALLTSQQISFFNQDGKILVLYCTRDINNMKKNLRKELQMIQENFVDLQYSTILLEALEDKQYAKYNTMVTHDWINDSYAKGCYAGYGLDSNHIFDAHMIYQGVKIKKIFKPANNRIFFIGEHTTILDAIGTMEAAVESAERIVPVIGM